MIQLIQVAGGDVYAVNANSPFRPKATHYSRSAWHMPYTGLAEFDIFGLIDAKIGEPLRIRTAVGWRQFPTVLRNVWMLEGGDIEESLYANEWIGGFEAFYHRGEWAANPYLPGSLENKFWVKGYDNAQHTQA